MTGVTSDRNDPRLPRSKHGPDEEPVPQQEVYLVLSEEERAKGFVRPVRSVYLHTVCGTETRIGEALAETYARDPSFYSGTYCVHCRMHRPLSEFVWLDGSALGS